MKLLGIISDKNYQNYLSTPLSGLIFPLKDYAVDYFTYYTLEEIKEYKKTTSKECYVILNKMIFNDEISSLLTILKELESIHIDGLFFYDLAILNLVKTNNLNLNLIFNQTHMVTNSDTINTYYNLGVKGAYLSNEITKSDILKIRKKTKSTLYILLAGKPVVAFSRRHLLSNYLEANKEKKEQELLIKEPKTNQEYLVKEDQFGTTFFYNKWLNLSNIYETLSVNNLDYGILKQDDLNTKDYLTLIANYDHFNKEKIDSLLGHNRGFLFRPTIYKVKKEAK